MLLILRKLVKEGKYKEQRNTRRTVKAGSGKEKRETERRGKRKAGAIFGAHVTAGSRWAGLAVKGKGRGTYPNTSQENGKIVL